jgi:hypothetical protein
MSAPASPDAPLKFLRWQPWLHRRHAPWEGRQQWCSQRVKAGCIFSPHYHLPFLHINIYIIRLELSWSSIIERNVAIQASGTKRSELGFRSRYKRNRARGMYERSDDIWNSRRTTETHGPNQGNISFFIIRLGNLPVRCYGLIFSTFFYGNYLTGRRRQHKAINDNTTCRIILHPIVDITRAKTISNYENTNNTHWALCCHMLKLPLRKT